MTSNDHDPPTLMNLPLEVRHHIFEYVCASNQPPKKLLRHWFEKREVKQKTAKLVAQGELRAPEIVFAGDRYEQEEEERVEGEDEGDEDVESGVSGDEEGDGEGGEGGEEDEDLDEGLDGGMDEGWDKDLEEEEVVDSGVEDGEGDHESDGDDEVEMWDEDMDEVSDNGFSTVPPQAAFTIICGQTDGQAPSQVALTPAVHYGFSSSAQQDLTSAAQDLTTATQDQPLTSGKDGLSAPISEATLHDLLDAHAQATQPFYSLSHEALIQGQTANIDEALVLDINDDMEEAETEYIQDGENSDAGEDSVQAGDHGVNEEGDDAENEQAHGSEDMEGDDDDEDMADEADEAEQPAPLISVHAKWRHIPKVRTHL